MKGLKSELNIVAKLFIFLFKKLVYVVDFSYLYS